MSTVLSFLSSAAPEPETPKNGDQLAGGQTRSANVQAKYAKQFATSNTVAKAAAAMKITHVGCLVQLYRYEKRNLVHRAGIDASLGRPILWKWGKKPNDAVS